MQKKWLVCLLALCAASASARGPQESLEQIQARLEERFPDVQIERIEPSKWPGMYAIVTATEIVYTNADASLLISGNLLDTKTHENLTRSQWNSLHAIDFDQLPFDRAIRIVKGNGARKLAIFSDPECPYCQQLEQSLREVSDVTLYVFLYPLEEVHPTARDKAIGIWCSQDRQQSWAAWMLERKEPDAKACNGDPIAELQELGQRLKVQSTPTLFFADGHRLPGAVPAAQLEQELKVAEERLVKR